MKNEDEALTAVENYLLDTYEDVLLIPKASEALMGSCERFGHETRACYNKKILNTVLEESTLDSFYSEHASDSLMLPVVVTDIGISIEQIGDKVPEAIIYDGFNDAIIGLAHYPNHPPIILYDRQKCIEILEQDDMTSEDAEDYFAFNVIGGWVGDYTPAFLSIPVVFEY